MDAQEFLQQVKELRRRQRDFFKTRTEETKQAAIRKEKLIDYEIDRVSGIVKRIGTPSEPNEAYKFYTIVTLMRDAQIEYFKRRDKGTMEMAKGFEKEVDAYITRKENPQQELFK